MAKRRRLRGKKLLIVSGAIAGVSFVGCGDAATANLIAPPDTGSMDSAMDAADTFADTASDTTTGDSASGDAMPDSAVIPIDAVANLIAPPDTGPDADGG